MLISLHRKRNITPFPASLGSTLLYLTVSMAGAIRTNEETSS